MQFDWVAALRLVHVLSSVAWAGAMFFAVFLLAPALKAAGPPGGALMLTVARRGGFGRVMGPVGLLTIATGALLYWRLDYHTRPFDGTPATLLSLGAIAGVAAILIGYIFGVPLQRRLTALAREVAATGPTAEQAAALQNLGARMARMGRIVPPLVGAALVLMVGRFVVY